MRTWPGLLLAPLLALADQIIAYAAVPWSCVHERAAAVHGLHVLFLVAATVTLWPASRVWRETRAAANDTDRRRHFLAGMALASAALSVLVIAALWMPTWFIAPCIA